MRWNALLEPNVERVRFLMGLSDSEADAICESSGANDAPALHTARFLLHIERGARLPNGYAWSMARSRGNDSAIANHVRTMAMYAIDPRDAQLDVDSIECVSDWRNWWLERAIQFQIERHSKTWSGPIVARLIAHSEARLRRLAISVMRRRPVPDRERMLTDLAEDSDRWIARNAEHALAAITRESDPARLAAETAALISGRDPDDGEWAIHCALKLEDRRLIAKLCDWIDWDTRSEALLLAISREEFDDTETQRRILSEDFDRRIELVIRWPSTATTRLALIAPFVCQPQGLLPEAQALAEGRPEAVARLGNWFRTNPTWAGAGLRLLPRPVAVRMLARMVNDGAATPKTLRVAAKVISNGRYSECYPLLAELCVHDDAHVQQSAAGAIGASHPRFAIYGLETAMLASRVADTEIQLALCRCVEARLSRSGDEIDRTY